MLREMIAKLLWEDKSGEKVAWEKVPDYHKRIYLKKADKLLTAIREAAEEGMRGKNPYPSDIFPMTIETAAKYVPYDKRDAVFGAWGRYVWELAVQEFSKLLKEE